MTQSPLGPNPSRPGPFDETGPGNPDVASTEAGTTSETAPVGGTTDTSDTGSTPSDAKDKAKEVAGTAQDEAQNVADTALTSGKQVAATAQDEARNVVAETKQQAASLLDTVRTEVGEQASTQQGRIAEALHSLSKELGSMASSSQESGPLTDLAHQASRKGGEVAHWLQDREPADVLDSVRSYARRRPGTFLVLCGLAGVVAGRLTRSTVANRTSLDSKDDSVPSADPRPGDSPGWSATPATTTAYDTAPAGAPVTDPAGDRSLGVYGGSLESTDPPPGTDQATLPGAGHVGTTLPADDPSGERTR